MSAIKTRAEYLAITILLKQCKADQAALKKTEEVYKHAVAEYVLEKERESAMANWGDSFNPELAALAAVETHVPKVKGISVRTGYKCKIVDVELFLECVDNGEVSHEAVGLDEAYMKKLSSKLGKDLQRFGIRATKTKSVVVSK